MSRKKWQRPSIAPSQKEARIPDRSRKDIMMPRRNVLHFRGSPVRSVRWKRTTWDRLYDLESQHNRKIKTNRIAEIAVIWGLAFLRTLSPELSARILGVKGEQRLTFEEEQKLRAELAKKLGSLTGAFRLDNRLTFALPTPAKQLIQEEAERSHTSMSAIVRRRTIPKEAA